MMLPLFGGGVTSEAAGQATSGTPYEIPARLLAAVAGTGSIMAGQSALDRASGMLAPWTQSGKQKLAADIIGGVTTDPRATIGKLERYSGDAVPGVNQTAPKVSADPGLLSLENYARGSAGNNNKLLGMESANNSARAAHLQGLESGEIGNFVQRLRGIDARLAADVEGALSTLPAGTTPAQAGHAIQTLLNERREALTTARRTAVQPLYDEVAQWAAPVDARNARIAATDLVNTTKGELQGTARGAGRTLYTGEGLPDNSAQGLVAARQDMAHRLSREGTTPAEGRILQRIQSETDRALEEAVPAARQARDTYAAMSVPLEPFERGRPVFNALNEHRPMDPALVPQAFMQPGQKGAAGVRGLNAADPRAAVPLREYVAGLVRGDVPNAGRVASNLGPALEALDPTLGPASLRSRIQSVAQSQDARAAFQETPMGRMVAGNNAPKELGPVLSSPDGQRQIGEMMLRAGNNEPAIRGLRQGILDDFKAAIESKGGTDAAGNQTLMSAQAKKWVDNKMQAANVALTADQQKGIRALVDSLDVQSRTAPKMAGSDTVRNAMSGTFMGKILSGGVSNIPGVSTLLKTAKTQEDVLRIVADTLADPQAAKVMLMKYNEGNAKLAAPILRRLVQAQPALASVELRQ